MDLAFYIYSYLQEQKPIVEVPDFGIFRLVKEHAVVDAESSKILPPSEHIYFEDNTAVFDSSLAHYIAEKTGENLFIIQSQMREVVREWIKLIMLQKKLKLKYIGELSLKEIDIVREETKNPQPMDFFGLEEVNLSTISPFTTFTAPISVIASFFAEKPVVSISNTIKPSSKVLSIGFVTSSFKSSTR